jgi:hypothetical protein
MEELDTDTEEEEDDALEENQQTHPKQYAAKTNNQRVFLCAMI